jgi:hypothetical protein
MHLKILLPLLLCATPLSAAPPGEKEKSGNDAMGDAVSSPLADLNVKKNEIPPLLLEIRDEPYRVAGIRTCNAIIAEVQKLDAVLGADIDRQEIDSKGRKRNETAAAVTKGVISSLIPFRFLIREVTGARSAEQEYREAIYAGVIRRSFLKGYGQARRCRAPGRPMNALESAGAAAGEVLKDEKRQ